MYSGGKDRHLHSGSASLSQCLTSNLGAQLCLLSRLTACHGIVFLPEWMTLLSAIGFRKRWRWGINSMARPQRLSTGTTWSLHKRSFGERGLRLGNPDVSRQPPFTGVFALLPDVHSGLNATRCCRLSSPLTSAIRSNATSTVAPTLPGFRLSLQDIEQPDQRYTPGRLVRDNEVSRCGATPAWPRVLTCPNGQTIMAQAPRE